MRTKLFLVLLLMCVSAAAISPAYANDNPQAMNNPRHAAKIQDIKKLMEVTGTGKLGVQVMDQVIAQFKTVSPDVPQKFWDEVMQEVSPDELVSLVVPIYDKYLSEDDIKGLIKFYESPLGQKLISVMPQISRESMNVGRDWGMQLVQRVEQKMKSEGYGQGGNSNSNGNPNTGTGKQ